MPGLNKLGLDFISVFQPLRFTKTGFQRGFTQHLVQIRIHESRHLQQIAQHPQNFPAGPGLPGRFHRGRRTLHSPLAIYERSGVFGERRNRQYNIYIIGYLIEHLKADDKLCRFHRQNRLNTISQIIVWFHIEQQIRRSRILDHLVGIQSRLMDRNTVGFPMRQASAKPSGNTVRRWQNT